MPNTPSVLEYKCPCCDAALTFGEEAQKLTCDSCGNEFEIETVVEYNRVPEDTNEPDFTWEESDRKEEPLPYQCPSCGGLIEYDDHTASTFCPYCDNPVILPDRLSAVLKPDAVIPFKTTKAQAQEKFRSLCKGKPLLPKDFMTENKLEAIQGFYVPFWLYNCDGAVDAKFRATRVHHWSDSNFDYKKTDYYLLTRAANAQFDRIPLDGSTKMNDAVMESIEPYDYSQLTAFDPAYLSGFLADKYDVEAKEGEDRIRERVGNTMEEMLLASCIGYDTVLPNGRNLKIAHSKASYVLLPLWLMTVKYKDKDYNFAMNGQTGKMTGTLPICPKRSAAWFCGIFAAVAALVTAIQWLVF